MPNSWTKKASTIFTSIALVLLTATNLLAQKHSPTSAHTSYTGLIMTGYQGWFGTPGDGVTNNWRHYNGGNGFRPGSASIEYWPDMREADEDEKYSTDFVFADGAPAYVFSSVHPKTVMRHFQWMKEYGIDGAFMQRFRSDFGKRPTLNAVLKNGLDAARAQGRAISLMYDIGANIRINGVPNDAKRTQEVNLILDDWKALLDDLQLTTGGADQPYLYHNGKPLIVLWGVGFNHRHTATGLDIQYWADLVDSLQNAPGYGGCSIMLGVPRSWRTGGGDCISGSEHAKMLELIKTVDIIQPWHTSRYRRTQMGTAFKNVVSDDIAWCETNGIDYTPTISPGIREKILHGNGYEQFREGGYYFWDMARAAIEAGSKMLYLGMFDEIDEGTQYFKINNNPPFYSDELNFTDYGKDPQDHYLWLAGEAGRALRGEFTMGPLFRQRAVDADFQSVITSTDNGSSYQIDLTEPAPGRRVFYAPPYTVPDGAPTVGTVRDPNLFTNELISSVSFNESQKGTYIRFVEVNENDQVVAFKAFVAAHGYAPIPYSTSFEEGVIDARYWTISSDNDSSQIQVTEEFGPHTGQYHLAWAGDGDSAQTNNADLHLNLSGISTDLILQVSVKNNGAEIHPEDGIYFSDDAGLTFTKVHDFGATTDTYAEISLDINQLAKSAGLNLNGQFIIRFHHRAAQTGAGTSLDDIRVLHTNLEILKDSNGSFEEGLAFWRFFEVPNPLGSSTEIIQDDIIDGANALKITYMPADATLRDRALDNWDAPMSLQPDTIYSLTFWAKSDSPNDGELNCSYGFFDADKKVLAESKTSFELATAYREFTVDFTTSVGSTSGWVAFRWKDKSGDDFIPGIVYLDHIQLWEGGKKATNINEASVSPDKFDLRQNYPNPFNPTTTIDFYLPKAARTNLAIYNTLGQRIRVLIDDFANAGLYRVVWDGRDQLGKSAATGVYFYRLASTAGIQTKRMALIR
ncbi:MAG: T9SS type A sorting domain-containing protein [Candidatus Latescibacteria bacterium]|nr:T9SS type A sorting domain-containing protein [Candidatus Latescibacterota bacterium]